jgi:hypothetical protein
MPKLVVKWLGILEANWLTDIGDRVPFGECLKLSEYSL